MSVIDLNAIAVKAMENIVASGVIEKKVEEVTQKALETIIADAFLWNTPAYKELKTIMQEKLQVDFSRLDLPVYNEFLLERVKQIITAQIEENGVAPFGEQITQLLKREVKPQYNLFQLLDEFKNIKRVYYNRDNNDYLTLHIKRTDYGSIKIAIDEEEDKDYWSCSYRFYIDSNNNTIFGVELRDNKDSANKATNILFTDSFGELLLRIRAAGSQIFVTDENTDDYNLSYYDEEDY